MNPPRGFHGGVPPRPPLAKRKGIRGREGGVLPQPHQLPQHAGSNPARVVTEQIDTHFFFLLKFSFIKHFQINIFA